MTPDTETNDSGNQSDDQPEVIDRLGNAIMVRDGGTARFVPRSPKTLLKYEHCLTELFNTSETDDPIILNDNPSLAVAPTDNECVYVLWKDGTLPVRNPPSRNEDVLSAILDIVENRSVEAFESLYDSLFATQARPEVLNQVLTQYAPIPPTSVVPESSGWVVEGMFLLTWQTNTYLVTRDYSQKAYNLGLRKPIDEEPQLLRLEPSLPETSIEIPLDDGYETTPTKLSERELNFLTKASWLVDYRENYNDDVYWTQIERLVRTETNPF